MKILYYCSHQIWFEAIFFHFLTSCQIAQYKILDFEQRGGSTVKKLNHILKNQRHWSSCHFVLMRGMKLNSLESIMSKKCFHALTLPTVLRHHWIHHKNCENELLTFEDSIKEAYFSICAEFTMVVDIVCFPFNTDGNWKAFYTICFGYQTSRITKQL